ncbi:MAG: 50S ribosomal protein L21 [Deltaproteobacteria bacterium]|nr:50S ribosomal protein L21 [Deltaproteobacteria bacterium]
MYAIIRTGGKQYKVSEGDFLKVEKLAGNVGDTVELSEVLMVAGDSARVGDPLVAGAKVTACIVEQKKDRKVLVFHHKRRKNHRKAYGHRQPKTHLKILSVEA